MKKPFHCSLAEEVLSENEVSTSSGFCLKAFVRFEFAIM